MCLLCTPPNSAQDCASLEKSSFMLSLARISLLEELEGSFLLNTCFIEYMSFTCYNSWGGCLGSRINCSGPVIWHVSISCSDLPGIRLFPADEVSGIGPMHPRWDAQLCGNGEPSPLQPLPHTVSRAPGTMLGTPNKDPVVCEAAATRVWDGVSLAQNPPRFCTPLVTSPGPSCLFSNSP